MASILATAPVGHPMILAWFLIAAGTAAWMLVRIRPRGMTNHVLVPVPSHVREPASRPRRAGSGFGAARDPFRGLR